MEKDTIVSLRNGNRYVATNTCLSIEEVEKLLKKGEIEKDVEQTKLMRW